MLDLTSEQILIGMVGLCFLLLLSMNERLKRAEATAEELVRMMHGLRQYLYEIDPQFDDERQLAKELDDSLASGNGVTFAGMSHMELIEAKESAGRRTLCSPFA